MSDIDLQLYSQLRRSEFLHATILEGFMQGIFTTLLLHTIFAFSNSIARKQRGSQIIMGLLVVLWSCIMIDFGTGWHAADQAFIIHGDTADDVVDYLNTGPLVTDVLLPSTSRAVALLIGDSIIVWRCWVVWSQMWLPIIPLILMNLCTMIFIVITLVCEGLPPTHPFLAKFSLVQPGTVIFALTLATTVLATTLIVVRIAMLGHLRGVSKYRGVIELVVESAALYSLSVILVLPFWVQTDPVKQHPTKLMQVIMGSMIGIAPTLLFARVVSGGGRPSDSWQTTKGSGPQSALNFKETTMDMESETTTQISVRIETPHKRSTAPSETSSNPPRPSSAYSSHGDPAHLDV